MSKNWGNVAAQTVVYCPFLVVIPSTITRALTSFSPHDAKAIGHLELAIGVVFSPEEQRDGVWALPFVLRY